MIAQVVGRVIRRADDRDAGAVNDTADRHPRFFQLFVAGPPNLFGRRGGKGDIHAEIAL